MARNGSISRNNLMLFSLAPLLHVILLLYTSAQVDSLQARRKGVRGFGDDDDEDRIVGGRPVTQGNTRYEWFAKPALYGGSVWVGCGGSLVAPNYGKGFR